MASLKCVSLAIVLVCAIVCTGPTQAQTITTKGDGNSSHVKRDECASAPGCCEKAKHQTPDNRGEHRQESPKLRPGQDVFTDEQLEKVNKFLDDRRNCKSVTELGHDVLTMKYHASQYSDMFLHRYESFDELKQSGGPHVDQELCLKQLNHLIDRAKQHAPAKFSSTDINLELLLDTFGRVPAGMFRGNTFWVGAYDDCISMKIETPDGAAPTRYCVGSIKHRSWPNDTALSDILTLKVGVCLPKSCDSLRYKNKYELVQQLAEFNALDSNKNEVYTTDLYCLPDPDSSLTVWWRSPKTLATVAALACWMLALIFATVKFESATNGTGPIHDEQSGQVKSPSSDQMFKIYKSLAITNNMRLLFNTTKAPSLIAGDEARTKTIGEHEPTQQQVQQSLKSPIVDLSVIEGIKVLGMIYVILGHVIMCIMILINNANSKPWLSSVTLFISNLTPAFAVNAFFAITGLLTSYLVFKQNKSHSFVTKPGNWIAFIAYRYLRIMPMYALAVLYVKQLSRYAGSGPLWDYGTSSLAHRRVCAQESWLWTLLFGANFKSPLEHCIPSAWYLANDFQFFVVTPPFLALLHKRPATGKVVVALCIAAGYAASFWNVFTSPGDLRPVARFMPHGFKTYVTYLPDNYTRPYYRIPAYLCGLLIGYALHNYEQDKLKYLAAKLKQAGREHEADKEPDWPDSFKRFGLLCSGSLLFLVCVAAPLIGARLKFNKFYANVSVALAMPSGHLLFAVGVGMFILLATTGHGNKTINSFLGAPFWKPLARLSLCAVLVNVEVVSYLYQVNIEQQAASNQYHVCCNILSILATYLVATVVCVTFEAPVRAALNHLLAIALKMVAKQKAD